MWSLRLFGRYREVRVKVPELGLEPTSFEPVLNHRISYVFTPDPLEAHGRCGQWCPRTSGHPGGMTSDQRDTGNIHARSSKVTFAGGENVKPKQPQSILKVLQAARTD